LGSDPKNLWRSLVRASSSAYMQLADERKEGKNNYSTYTDLYTIQANFLCIEVMVAAKLHENCIAVTYTGSSDQYFKGSVTST